MSIHHEPKIAQMWTLDSIFLSSKDTGAASPGTRWLIPRDAVIPADYEGAKPEQMLREAAGILHPAIFLGGFGADMLASWGEHPCRHPMVSVISSDSPLASCPGSPASDRLSPCQQQDRDFTAGSFNQLQRSAGPWRTTTASPRHPCSHQLGLALGLSLSVPSLSLSLSQIGKDSNSVERSRLTIP